MAFGVEQGTARKQFRFPAMFFKESTENDISTVKRTESVDYVVDSYTKSIHSNICGAGPKLAM